MKGGVARSVSSLMNSRDLEQPLSGTLGATLSSASDQGSLSLLCVKHCTRLWHKPSQETHLRAQREVAGEGTGKDFRLFRLVGGG